MIEEYLVHTVGRLAELQAALALGNVEVSRHLAHTIKGSSASFGASALARMCGEIEAGGGPPVPADDTRARLDKEFAAVQAALKAQHVIPMSILESMA